MTGSDFIVNLLEALNDKKIKQKIISIIEGKNDETKISNKNVSEEEYIKLDDKILELEDIIKKEKSKNEELLISIRDLENAEFDLKSRLGVKDNSINNLEKENSDLDRKCIELQQKLDYEKNEILKINTKYQLVYGETKQIQEKLSYYEDTYRSLDSIYAAYKNLKNEIHKELTNVVKMENSEIFLCSGVQWDNIEALWSFISYKLNEYDENEIGILTDIFRYFFERYNEIHRLYALLEVNTNEEFDEDLHTRASNSCVAGRISEVLLKGYKNIRTNKIIQKSIVRV